MNIDSLLELFEDLVFRILSWILFIPKTYLLAIYPGKAPSYVDAQWDRPRPERYDDAISPILFYFVMVLIGAIPVDPAADVTAAEYLQRLLGLSELQLIGAFLLNFLMPIGIAILLRLAKRFQDREVIDRDSLRRLFELQCLLWGVFATFGPLVGLIVSPMPESWVPVIDAVLRFHPIAAWIFFAYLQSFAFERELGLRRGYAFLLSLPLVFGIRWLLIQAFGDPYAALFELAGPG